MKDYVPCKDPVAARRTSLLKIIPLRKCEANHRLYTTCAGTNVSELVNLFCACVAKVGAIARHREVWQCEQSSQHIGSNEFHGDSQQYDSKYLP